MPTRFARLNPSLRGPAMMIGACAGFAAMMAIVRHVSSEIPPLEAVFFRNLLGTVLILPLVFYAGWDQLHTGRPAMHLLRAVLGLISMLLLFTALSLLPLADVTALSFTARGAGRRRWWASAARSSSCVPAWAPSAGPRSSHSRRRSPWPRRNSRSSRCHGPSIRTRSSRSWAC